MFKEVTAVAALTSEDPPDGSHLNIVDPYDGCTIGCPYCFQRGDPSWSHPVLVKFNMPELLRRELSSWSPTEPVYVGSRCDPYMPIEKHYQLTRRCLATLSDLHIPTYLCSKANPALISRDLDIMASFQADFTVVLGLSNLSQIAKAGSADKTQNVKFATQLHNRGIKVWAFVMPVLPGITDVHSIIEALPTDVPIWLFGLKRPVQSVAGKVLLKYISRHYPHLMQTYQQLYDGAPDAYYERLFAEFSPSPRIRFPYG